MKSPERPRRKKAPGRKRPRTSNLRRVLVAAVSVLFLLALGVGILVLRMGPERASERAAHFVPGMTATLVIPEGFNLFQVADRLETLGICPGAEFFAVAHNPTELRTVGVLADSAEGYLFPATYELLRGSRPARVLELLVRTRRKRLTSWAAPIARAGLSQHDLLTLASIVERETGRDEERPRVARVFLNRLADVTGPTRGRLQSDPTAAYGCQKLPTLGACQGFSGAVSPEMLRDADNPYNTYRVTGLPPGPIANPGDRAIEAVLRPAPGNELYFVADGRGGHTFSRTFEEHRTAVERLKASQN